IGFTSNNLKITHKILKEITNYSINKARIKNTLYLLEKLPKVAQHYYEQMTKGMKEKPNMEFVYAGTVLNRALVLNGKDLFNFLKKFRSMSVSPQIYYAIKNTKNGITHLPPPASVLAKQTFPNLDFRAVYGFGFAFSGVSGQIKEKLEEAYLKIIESGEIDSFKIVITKYIIDDFCKDKNIKTIGGLTQIILLNKTGLHPMQYSYANLDKDGKKINEKSISFKNGKWIQYDKSKGKEINIKQNPLLITEDNIFDV
ncbi:unnamed protein product, partial [marine sediment metagenome]